MSFWKLIMEELEDENLLGSTVLGGSPFSWGLTQKHPLVSPGEKPRKIHSWLWQGEEKINHFEYDQRVLYYKGLFSGEGTIRALSHQVEGHFSTWCSLLYHFFASTKGNGEKLKQNKQTKTLVKFTAHPTCSLNDWDLVTKLQNDSLSPQFTNTPTGLQYISILQLKDLEDWQLDLTSLTKPKGSKRGKKKTGCLRNFRPLKNKL